MMNRILVSAAASILSISLLAGCSSSVEKSSAPASAPLISTFGADPDTIDFGDATTLLWSTKGATQIRLHAGDEELSAELVANGSLEIRPERTITYVLTAQNDEGEVIQESVQVRVTPAILTLTIDAAAPVAVGDEVLVSWETGGASTLHLHNGEGFFKEIPAEAIAEGSAVAPVSSKGTFTLVATSGDLETSKTVSVNATQVLSIDHFVALPSRVGIGESFEIFWATTNAERVELELDGLRIGDGLLEAQGSMEHTLAATGVFVLNAIGTLEHSIQETLTVTVGPPLIVDFSSDRTKVAPNSPILFTWKIQGGISLQVVDGEGKVISSCSTQDPGIVSSGSCDVQAPPALGSYEYLLAVTNGIGEVTTGLATVHVIDGPRIELFEASSASIDEGDYVTLNWRTDADVHGITPDLLLQDDRGTSYPLEGIDPIEGSFTLPSLPLGEYLFTLVASTPKTIPASETVSVTVRGLPSLTFTATPDVLEPGIAEQAELSWTSEHAVSLSVWALDEDGAPAGTPLLATENDATVESGSIVIQPAHTTTYRATATNQNGTAASRDLKVEVLTPEILSFTATPAVVTEDGLVVLRWETENAHEVTLDYNPGYYFEIHPLPFIDLRTSSNAQLLPVEDFCGTDESWVPSCPLLEFPSGFLFGYGGRPYDRMKVFTNGLVSFDLARDNTMEPPSYEVEDILLPTNPDGEDSSVGWGDLIAPFWSSMWRYDEDDSGILYELKTDPIRGRYLVTQWTENYDPVGCYDTELPINLVLWEDGGFDFRYDVGRDPYDYSFNPDCHGAAAMIGYQLRGGTVGYQVSPFLEPVPSGNISINSYVFTPIELALSGSIELNVPTTRTITLTAKSRGGAEVSQTVEVQAAPRPRLTSVEVATSTPSIHQPVTFDWTSSDLTALEIQDADGKSLCQAEEEFLPWGSCTVTATTPGYHDFYVVASGHRGSKITRIITVEFWPELQISEFKATPDSFDFGTANQVSLGWRTTGGSSLQLFANGVDMSSSLGDDIEEGEIILHPEESTLYQLVLHGEGRRKVVADAHVEVRTLQLSPLTASSQQTDGTQEVTLSWQTSFPSPHTLIPSVTSEPHMFPMEEVFDSPFIDISDDGGVPVPDMSLNRYVNAKVDFPEGFSFPYFGNILNSINVSTVGYLGSISGGTIRDSARLLEYRFGGSAPVLIAPFWDDLYPHGRGNVYTKLEPNLTDPLKDQFIIQWHKMHFRQTSGTPPAEEEMTFQVGLFRDGSIEFRYDMMVSPDTARAGGSNVAVGFRRYEDLWHPPYVGTELFFHLSNPTNFSNRSFAARARKPTDSYIVRPDKTTEYNICVELAGYKECQSTVVVVPDLGNLMVTELNLKPAGGTAEQWFEVRNTTQHPIDLRGMTLQAGGSEHVISSASPVEVKPGSFLVLGGGSGPHIDYIYGNSLALGTDDGSLTIRHGSRDIAVANWNAELGWSIPAEKTLSLDPIYHLPGVLSVSDPDAWCEGTGEGSPGTAFGCSSRHYDYDPFANRPFVDIRETGVQFRGLEAAPVPGGIGFPFPYFGDVVSNIWVSGHGFAAVSGLPEPMAINRPIPASGFDTPGIIAPLWTPLNLTDGAVHFDRREIDDQKVLILQWTEVVRPGHRTIASRPGSTSFQMQLWENGDIVFVYGRMSAVEHITEAEPTADKDHFGGRGTVGIEAIGGAEGIQYLYQEPILWEGQAISFNRKP